MKTYLIKHENNMIEEAPAGAILLTREDLEKWADKFGLDVYDRQIDEIFGGEG